MKAITPEKIQATVNEISCSMQEHTTVEHEKPEHEMLDEQHTDQSSIQQQSNEDEDDCHLQIVLNRVRTVTIKVPISINGTSAKAVVDTGAEVTVISYRVYDAIPEDKKPPLKEAK